MAKKSYHTSKLVVVRTLCVVTLFGLLLLPLGICFVIAATIIDSLTGWGNNFDSWAQASLGAQIIAAVLVIGITIGLFLALSRSRMVRELFFGRLCRSIASSNIKFGLLLIAFALVIAQLFVLVLVNLPLV